MEYLHQVWSGDVVHPVASFEFCVVVGERVAATPKRRQRRRLPAGVGAELPGRNVVAQELSRATDLGLSGGCLHGGQPTLMNGVVRVHTSHNLIG